MSPILSPGPHGIEKIDRVDSIAQSIAGLSAEERAALIAILTGAAPDADAGEA